MKFKVFLINLDKSTDRLAVCEQNFARFGIEFERVAAVYGKDLSAQQIERFYDSQRNQADYKKDLSIGELGCYLSHIACWQKILDEDLDYALILEDDFELSASFQDFEHLFSQLTNWDYVRIAYPIKQNPSSARVKITNDYDLIYYQKVPINTLAQGVSRRGAEKLLAKSQRVFRPIDVDMKHYWEKDINVLGIDPPLIKAHHNFTSEIDKISGDKVRKGNTRFFRNLRYLVKYKLKRRYFDARRPGLEAFIKS